MCHCHPHHLVLFPLPIPGVEKEKGGLPHFLLVSLTLPLFLKTPKAEAVSQARQAKVDAVTAQVRWGRKWAIEGSVPESATRAQKKVSPSCWHSAGPLSKLTTDQHNLSIECHDDA